MIIKAGDEFSIGKTFDCGQCFRFEPIPKEAEAVSGIAYGRYMEIRRINPEEIEIIGDSDADFYRSFLDLDTDYGIIDSKICSAIPEYSEIMRDAAECSRGIRILRQDPWETLISFIISQNNNIPRIKGIISAMCRRYGERIGDGRYAFPTAKRLADSSEEEIFTLRCGFRAKYIYDAACRVASGETSLETIAALPDYARADSELRKICGVGPKVAACVLLFGFARKDAFPIDVWMKRVIGKYFPDGLDHRLFGEYAGIAQQYLFYYERWHGGEK